jgi:S1-C subfamily serine protease
MKLTHAFVILSLWLVTLLQGCVTYQAIGVFQDFNEVMYGEVNANLLLGGSDFKFEGKLTGLKCQGSSNVTYIPPLGQCRGQRGDIFATCTDGRSITGEWFGQSCTSGYGRGKDSYGSVFAFTFGMSESEAQTQLKAQLASSGRKPDLPTYNPKETRREKGFSTGTGFFVSSSGHLITNFHVIDGAENIFVRTSNGVDMPAAVIARDPANDVALLKVEAVTRAIPIGTATKLSKGAEVMTLGYPLVHIQGQEQKATFGHINSLSGIDNDIRFFQIDVPVQPGNSGGPLIATNGNVVGVVTATLNQINTLKESGTLPQNVNYAVKADYILPMLLSIGVQPVDMSQDLGFEELVRQSEPSIVLVISK